MVTPGRRPLGPATRSARGGQVPPGAAGQPRGHSPATAGRPGAMGGAASTLARRPLLSASRPFPQRQLRGHPAGHAGNGGPTTVPRNRGGRPAIVLQSQWRRAPSYWPVCPQPNLGLAGVDEFDGPRGFACGSEPCGRCAASSTTANPRLSRELGLRRPHQVRPRGLGRPAASFAEATLAPRSLPRRHLQVLRSGPASSLAVPSSPMWQ